MDKFNAEDARKIAKKVVDKNKEGQPYLDIALQEIQEAAKAGDLNLILWENWHYRMPAPDQDTKIVVSSRLEERGFIVKWFNPGFPTAGYWRANWE